MPEKMKRPTLFVSHKHADREIAQVIANFASAQSIGKVNVYFSSDPTLEGPKMGSNLNKQLREALWKTDVLILIYTVADQDWQYCMWECGIAETPKSVETKIIVFQCGTDVPKPFQDVMRVDARKWEDIKKFVDQFFKDKDFFPSLNEALASDFKETLVDEAVDKLHLDLQKVLYEPVLTKELSVWGLLKLGIPKIEVDKLKIVSESESINLSHQIVKESAIVAEINEQTLNIFGLIKFDDEIRFEELVNNWKRKYPNEDTAWFGSCCEQIVAGIKRNFPIIRWTPIKEINGDDEFIPVLSRITQAQRPDDVHFYIYLYNLSDPRGKSVIHRMLKPNEFFYKKIGIVNAQGINLLKLVAEMESNKLNRLPILNDEKHPMYMVHRSMIDKFIVKIISGGEKVNPSELTLNDLLADEEMKAMFENTFAIVKKQTSLAEAKDAMLSKPGCSDVFVTENGGLNEPVQGWLTNIDITRSS